MTNKTLILSDTHLGRPGNAALSAEALRPLWQGFQCLILNGDTAELHHPAHRISAAKKTIRLFDYCEEDGIEVFILSGNHDPFISDHRHLDLAGGQIFVTHGDVFHPAVAPWSPRAGRMRKTNRKAFKAFRPDTRSTLEARLRASQFASHAEWDLLNEEAGHSSIQSMMFRPWALFQVLHYWWRYPTIAARFADEHKISARYLVTGHTHRPGIWEVGNRTIINTGSYGFPGKPMGVTLTNDTLSVFAIELNNAEYQLAETAEKVYQLEPSQEEADLPSALNTREVRERLSAVAT